MNIGIICSNNYTINKYTASGTAVFNYSLIENLAKYVPADISFTAFASGDSTLPMKIESIADKPSSADAHILEANKHVMFELALLSKAFSMQEQFDLYHINIGDGDLAVPFAPFVKKPLLITIHYIWDRPFTKNYFSLFKKNKNIFFISVSNTQRKLLPDLPYIETIYHGIDTKLFAFNAHGGNQIMWAGRAVPEKGTDIVVRIANETRHEANLFGITRKEYSDWLQTEVIAHMNKKELDPQITLTMDCDRIGLIRHFQKSKVFLFPVKYEEAFGLVLTEAMSCGTPIVAFAKGAIPEIIKDGETGFIVNESEDDIRGDFVVKKTGIEGLREAVERIYSLPEEEYITMRRACRKHVEEKFTVEQMVKNYLRVYKELAKHQTTIDP